MARADQNLLPSRVVQRALQTGVDTLTANPALVAQYIGLQLEDTVESGKVVQSWTNHPPIVVHNYPRSDSQMPCYAITIMSDRTVDQRLGHGEETWFLDGMNDPQGNRFSHRNEITLQILVYATHPEVCMWWYRIARRILITAFPFFLRNDLDQPRLDGQDLVPEPRYDSEHMFVRRVMLSFQYEETWTDQDALWTALNGAGYPTGVGSTVDIRHRDSGGKVTPIEED